MDLKDVDNLANRALALWDLPEGSRADRINVSENVTYLVTASRGVQSVLRVHRAGYHSLDAIQSELAWIAALRDETRLLTAASIPGRDGQLVQSVHTPETRHLVMFTHLPGETPPADADTPDMFATLGRIAAQTHRHAKIWQRPSGFTRLTWDTDAVFGATPIWGHWRDAPGVTPAHEQVLARTEDAVKKGLLAYGTGPERFGLIHADMRHANLLIDGDRLALIDFDDCGFGWFMYDFAASVSFIEDSPHLPAFKAAWVAAYRELRPLDAEDLAAMDCLVLLRRFALLAWIGSHIEAPEPQTLAPDFADRTAALCVRFMGGRKG